MQTETQFKGLQVREKRVELTISHLDQERTFIYPPVRGIYAECAKQLDSNGLYQPTFSEIVSLVHTAWQKPEEKYLKEIIQLLRDSWIRGFTGILYMPKEGAYIQDNPSIKDGRVLMNKKDLVEKLESHNPSVRFVPFGYKIGKQFSRDLAKNKFVIALANGKEQAKKLAEIADNYNVNPYLWSFNSVNEPITRVSDLSSYFSVSRLDVDGDNYDGDRGGRAFGKLKEAA